MHHKNSLNDKGHFLLVFQCIKLSTKTGKGNVPTSSQGCWPGLESQQGSYLPPAFPRLLVLLHCQAS